MFVASIDTQTTKIMSDFAALYMLYLAVLYLDKNNHFS